MINGTPQEYCRVEKKMYRTPKSGALVYKWKEIEEVTYWLNQHLLQSDFLPRSIITWTNVLELVERWRAQTRPAHAQCSSAHARAGKGAEKSVHCLSCLEGGERLEAAEDSEVVTEIEATVASRVLGIPDKIQNKNNRQGEISDQRLNISHLVLF